MDKKTFFHKVSQMRAVQREYFKTRSSAALASSKLLERQIDEEIKRAKAVMTAKARLFYELVDIDPQINQEWLNDHIRASLDFFFCDADVQHQRWLATRSSLPTQHLNSWVMACTRQRLLRFALYASQ